MLQTKPTQLETETIRLDNILGYVSLAGLVLVVVLLLLILLLLVHVVLLLPIVLAVLPALVALRFPLGFSKSFRDRFFADPRALCEKACYVGNMECVVTFFR